MNIVIKFVVIIVCIVTILLGLLYIVPYYLFGPSAPHEQVDFIVLNRTNIAIDKISFNSNRGSSSYTLQVFPSELIRIYTYSRGEDSPKITIRFSDGQELTDQDYVEWGYTRFIAVCSTTEMKHIYSFWKIMYPRLFIHSVCI